MNFGQAPTSGQGKMDIPQVDDCSWLSLVAAVHGLKGGVARIAYCMKACGKHRTREHRVGLLADEISSAAASRRGQVSGGT